MMGVKATQVPGTRKFVIAQSYTLLGVFVLAFAALAAVPAFFTPQLREHPAALWTVRLVFCIGPALLGLGALTRRQVTVLDADAKTYDHVESWMGSSKKASGPFVDIDALEFVLTERPRSTTRPDPDTWSAVLCLSVRGRKLPVFEASLYLKTSHYRRWSGDTFLDSLSAEEFARRLSAETGLRLDADLPRFWRASP